MRAKKFILKLFYLKVKWIKQITIKNRIILDKNASNRFKNIFTLENIEQTYKSNIAIKDFRGIDRIGRYQFEKNRSKQFEIIQKKCINGLYKFSPYVERLKLRGSNRKPRIISIPTMRDRIVLALLKDYLHSIFPECVNRKLPNSYIKEIKDFNNSISDSKRSYYKVDIDSFYDTIQHERLLNILCSRISSKPEMSLLTKSIRTLSVPIGQSKVLSKNKKNTLGVPQGLAISNILANIYLYETDEKFQKLGLKYLRYVDDMLFIIRSTGRKEIEKPVKKELNRIGLNISKNKTVFIDSREGLDYLGYHLKFPTITVRQATVERYLRSLSALFSTYLRKRKQPNEPLDPEMIKDIFISDVNEKITGAISNSRRYGWIFYFLEMNDLSLLYTIDRIIQDRFCGRIKEETFKSELIKSIKKLSKAYYYAKFNPLGGYIHNYDTYDTIPKKMKFLVSHGIIPKNSEARYRPEDIEYLFDVTVKKRLSELEADVGATS